MLSKINQSLGGKIIWFSVLLFVISVLPLLLLGKYNVMCADDYSYGVEVHDMWRQTGSFWQTVKCAAAHTRDFYLNWQGTYTSCFLMSMCPMHFNYKCAFLVPVIMIGMLSASTYLFGRQIFVRWFGGDERSYIFIGCMLLFLFWQVIDSPFDGVYWYNGATHYILMQAFMFFMLTAVSGMIWTHSRKHLLVLCVFSSISGLIVGGGNLVTGLQAQILLVFLLLYTLWTEKKKIVYVSMPTVCYTFGFLINVLAPGNIARGEEMETGYGVVKSVLLSFYNAFVYIGKWTLPMVVLVWIAVAPFLWNVVKKSKRKFGYPGLVTLGFFCVFSAMFTPNLFAMGIVGVERINNIIQLCYYLSLFSVTAYWFGWLSHSERLAEWARRHKTMGGGKCYAVLVGLQSKMEHYGTILTLAVLAVIMAVWVFTTDKNTYAGISALRSLVVGNTQIFYEEEMERYEMYLDEAMPYVIVEVHTERPYLFGDRDLNWDSDFWINRSMTRYYHKYKIIRRVE